MKIKDNKEKAYYVCLKESIIHLMEKKYYIKSYIYIFYFGHSQNIGQKFQKQKGYNAVKIITKDHTKYI